MKKIKVGDVVTLKSGSPKMTVESVVDNLHFTQHKTERGRKNSQSAHCVWIPTINAEPQRMVFDTACLIREVPDGPR